MYGGSSLIEPFENIQGGISMTFNLGFENSRSFRLSYFATECSAECMQHG